LGKDKSRRVVGKKPREKKKKVKHLFVCPARERAKRGQTEGRERKVGKHQQEKVLQRKPARLGGREEARGKGSAEIQNFAEKEVWS